VSNSEEWTAVAYPSTGLGVSSAQACGLPAELVGVPECQNCYQPSGYKAHWGLVRVSQCEAGPVYLLGSSACQNLWPPPDWYPSYHIHGNVRSPYDSDRRLPTTSVSNGSKLPGQFRVRIHTKPDHGNGSYHTKNPDRWIWAGFTTKYLAFQVPIFGCN